MCPGRSPSPSRPSPSLAGPCIDRCPVRPRYNSSWCLLSRIVAGEAKKSIWSETKYRLYGAVLAFIRGSRRLPTLPRVYTLSTMGLDELNDSVRDGKRCGLARIITSFLG